MPELPEVETSCRGITPHVTTHPITEVIIRCDKLRWPIPASIHQLKNQHIAKVSRRGKYILLHTAIGTAILHLGMSGRLHIVPQSLPPKKHDHVDIVFSNALCLRLNDTRRFGALLWTQEPVQQHKLLKHLGPEPLTSAFSEDYFAKKIQNKNLCIKSLLMDAHFVVGVGNIYANEALFKAGIHPQRPSKSLQTKEITLLVNAVKTILHQAIEAGGTTLKDFENAQGKPGYFQQQLFVYGRAEQPCLKCETVLQSLTINQRATVFCPSCQP